MSAPVALRNRLLLREAMDMIEEIGPDRADLRERRLAAHSGLRREDRRQILEYCERFEAAARLCAKQVREGAMALEAGAACLSEQFPELDLDQVGRGLAHAMRPERG